MQNATTYGIEGYKAHEFLVNRWIDADGKRIEPIKLSEYEGKFKVVYCFQSWCPGCHSRGFPALQEMTKALKNNDQVTFLAVQTVFEGQEVNTYDKIIENQRQYDLKIPFGHDNGDESKHNRSSMMYYYRTGGTPWFIFIDQKNTVVFNDYHVNIDNAIDFLSRVG